MKTITLTTAVLLVAVSSPSQAQDSWIAALAGADRIEVEETDTSTTAHKTDAVYGIAAGHDFRVGSLFTGPEVEATVSEIRERTSGLVVPSDELTLDLSHDLYAGLRIGHRLTPKIALYAKAGYSNLRYRAAYRVGTNAAEIAHDELQGYRLGAGLEYAPGKLFGRLEYRFSDYGNHQDSGLSTRRHQVAASVGFRF